MGVSTTKWSDVYSNYYVSLPPSEVVYTVTTVIISWVSLPPSEVVYAVTTMILILYWVSLPPSGLVYTVTTMIISWVSLPPSAWSGVYSNYYDINFILGVSTTKVYTVVTKLTKKLYISITPHRTITTSTTISSFSFSSDMNKISTGSSTC